MNKQLITIVSLIFVVFLMPKKVHASTPSARPSAKLEMLPVVVEDKRAKILEEYLKTYNSPLAPYAENFIVHADKNRLDWKFLPAIAGVESYFGQLLPQNSYNGWGWGIYGNNVHYFASWDEAISTISKELRDKYMDKWGAKDVYGIGGFYAADPNWANKVTHFMNQIASFETQKENSALSISI